ncbi:hypothetical protein JCM8547_006911 [Rhodosporidiobolus lusitaniae]
MPASLSRELIEQFLDDRSLDSQTRLRCCLFSKAFYNFCFSRLYRNLRIEVIAVRRPPNDDMSRECYWAPSSLRLVERLL